MTLLVRDEEDIVSSNLDFHLNRGVDFIIATDNLSADGTADILREYERCGFLRYIRQSDDDYSQHRWVTFMARMATTRFAADWVINTDADEFWYPRNGDLKQVLGALPADCDAAAVERVNFVPRPDSVSGFFANTMIVRESHSKNALGHALSDKVCHRGFADIEVEQGNHMVRRKGRLITPTRCNATILHFPMRSYLQFANKIAKGGAAYERNTNLPKEVGSTWRYLYEVYKSGELERWYQSKVIDDCKLQAGLQQKTLIYDRRLADFFNGSGVGATIPE